MVLLYVCVCDEMMFAVPVIASYYSCQAFILFPFAAAEK